MPISIKRAYDPPAEADGVRVLVDRLWPRGVSKASAHIDQWLKDLAPSDGLRKWFGHDPARWDEFRKRYFKELNGQAEVLAELRKLARRGPVTLVYAAKDAEHNNAVALREFLGRRAASKRASARTTGGAAAPCANVAPRAGYEVGTADPVQFVVRASARIFRSTEITG